MVASQAEVENMRAQVYFVYEPVVFPSDKVREALAFEAIAASKVICISFTN